MRRSKQPRNIVIIGAGVSGLTAGIYAQLMGFNTVICEKNAVAGGLCSYWERQGFHLDNCIHWLTCSKDGSDLNRIWQDTHVLTPETELIRTPFFMQLQHRGKQLTLWRDLNRLQEEWPQIAPEDEAQINEFIRLLHIYSETVVVANKPLDLYHLIDWAKLLYKMRHVGKVHRIYSRMSLSQFAQRFHNPLLREFFTSYFPKHYNVASMLFVYAAFCSDNADLPRGGSKGIVQRMVQRYEQLGGKILYRHPVTALNIDQGQIRTVQLAGGKKLHPDCVIAACDLHHLATQLLPQYAQDKYIKEHFFTAAALYPTYSSVNVYIGVDTDKAVLPGTLWLHMNQLRINKKPVSGALVKDFNDEPSFAPAGKSVLQIIITQYEKDFDAWERLRKSNRQEYNKEKERIAQHVISELEKQFPAFSGKLHILDVATPVTNTRFCHVYKGAYMSFALTPYNTKINHPGRLPHLKNLYLAGQWLQAPGGLPNAAVTGKFAVQRICKDYRVKFK